MIYIVCRGIGALLLKVLFRIKIEGRENIPKKGGFILASNHVSYIDPIAVGVASPRRVSFMAKEELFVRPLTSWFMGTLETFPVKRDSADLSAIKEAIRRLKKGQGLVLFPEGSRRFDDGPGEPYPGIGFLAAKLNVPVIPVFIKGTDVALPRGAKFIKSARVSVFLGKQISIERGLPYQDIAREIMRSIRRLSC